MRNHYFASVAVLAIAIPAAAQAQDADIAQDAQEIVVTGQRAQQERAIEIKRETIGIADVVASDEIGRLPDRNVAEVIERLPGVGVSYDQGEGRYVAVRGVPPELNNYTINGIEIGNPDGTTRALPLDIISGQLLNRVEVMKVKTSDLDGQGIGGSINLVTQTAFDFAEPFVLQLNAQAGAQELSDDIPVRGDASIGGRFGSDDQFGILIGGSYSDRTYTSYGIYPDDWRPVDGAPRDGMPTNIKYTDYSLHRERIGATGSFDWRPNENHSFFIRGIYSRFTEDEYRQRYRLDFATNTILNAGQISFNADGTTGTATGSSIERRQDLRLEYKEKSVLVGMAGGQSHFDALTVDYVLARVHNRVYEPNDIWQFRCNPGTVDFDFSNDVFYAAPRTECTSSQLQFRQYTHQHEEGEEDIWQGRVDLTYNLSGMFDEGSFVRVGGKYRTTDKWFDSSNDTWGRASNPNRFSLDTFDLSGGTIEVYPRDGDTVYYNGPTIDADAIKAFTEANLNSAYFVYSGSSSLANETLNDVAIDEDVTSGYVMANLRFGAVTITPGVRFEHTYSSVTGYRLEDGTTVVPVTETNSYNDWLPSLIVRIEPSRDTVFRLAYSRSLGRPEYSALTPGGQLEYEDGSTPGTYEGSFATGNPNLSPYRSDNLDVSAEWYFQRGGLLSVGVFAKFVRNPIFMQTATLTNVTLDGRMYELLSVSQPMNAERGDIIGIEAQFQQQFTFLPGFWSGFGIAVNGTLTDSTLRLPDGRTTPFVGQSDYLYGAQIFYQRGIVEASIGYHNTGHALISVGATAVEDQSNDDLRRLDAKFSVEVMPGIRVFAEGQNLTDEPTRQYQWDRTDWVTQNERYGRTFYLGFSARF